MGENKNTKRTFELDEQLIANGYFSDELPPCFNSQDLYKHYSKLKSSLGKSPSEPMSFTIPKSEINRRIIKVPNPEQQLKLFLYIIENIDEITDILSSNVHSLSNPIRDVNFGYDELIPFFDIPALREKNNVYSNYINNLAKKLKTSMGFKYVFKLDIANFYDSIYTHSIEWAITSREEAKENIRKKKPNLGWCLDKLVRNTNSGETSGIPTGPFTSRIISEIILGEINKELNNLFKDQSLDVKFVHYVDDYEFYFRSKSDYNRIKQQIINIFHKYNLKVNDHKTEFKQYPFHFNKDIYEEYRIFIKRYNKNKKNQDARLLFFKADELTNLGYKGAYKYLYKLIKGIDFSDSWEEIEPFLIGHLLTKPLITQYIIHVIIDHKQFLSDKFIYELKENLFISLEQRLNNESQWIFWLLNKIQHKFYVDELERILSEANDDFLLIMVINYIYKFKRYRKSSKLTKAIQIILKQLELEHLDKNRWLIIYEWYFNKWINYEKLKPLLNESNFFNALHKNKINFFNANDASIVSWTHLS